MADSRAPDILVPLGSPPLDDDALLDAIQPLLSALSGIDGQLVRPRWQPDDTPQTPEYTVNWVAFGVARSRTDTFVYEAHVDDGADGHDVTVRNEELDLLLSFYGPRSRSIATQVLDGLQVGQNHAALQAATGLAYVGVSDPVQIPSLLHGKWSRREDVTVTVRRLVTRSYAVLSLLATPDGSGDPRDGLNNELYVTPIEVDAP